MGILNVKDAQYLGVPNKESNGNSIGKLDGHPYLYLYLHIYIYTSIHLDIHIDTRVHACSKRSWVHTDHIFPYDPPFNYPLGSCLRIFRQPELSLSNLTQRGASTGGVGGHSMNGWRRRRDEELKV